MDEDRIKEIVEDTIDQMLGDKVFEHADVLPVLTEYVAQAVPEELSASELGKILNALQDHLQDLVENAHFCDTNRRSRFKHNV